MEMGVFATIGSLGLIVATIAAGVALRREAPRAHVRPVLLGIAGWS